MNTIDSQPFRAIHDNAQSVLQEQNKLNAGLRRVREERVVLEDKQREQEATAALLESKAAEVETAKARVEEILQDNEQQKQAILEFVAAFKSGRQMEDRVRIFAVLAVIVAIVVWLDAHYGLFTADAVRFCTSL